MKINNFCGNSSSFRTSIVLSSLYQMMIDYNNLECFEKIYYSELEKTMKDIINDHTDVYYFIQNFLKKDKLSNWEIYNANSCTIKN